MAENKQEKKTIQVGDQKYLVDDILGLSAAQLNNYFNFARDKGGYDDEGIASLRNYINKRLDNIKAGQGFNADGSFDGDVVENVTMKVKKPGGFGKKEITQGNRDWANNYFYHLVKNLKPYQETEDKPSSPTWDISKHGLNAYLTGQGLDAKHIFENYDLKDTNNPDAARSFKQRRELLKQHLGGYRDWLKSKGFDFTKNDNEWDDNYLTDFESFVNNFDTLDNNALTTALRKYGAGNYTTAFTSDKWDLTKTNEALAAEREAEQARKAEEDKTKKYREYIDNTYANFQALEDNNFGGTYFTSKGDGFFDMSDSEYESWLNTHTDDKDAYMKSLQERYYANPFDVSAAGEYLPLAGRFGALRDVTIDGKTFKYDPNTIDRTKNRFVAFDPESGEIKHAFIGDIESEKEALRRKWLLANGYVNQASAYYEEGGVISMQTGGGFNLAQAVNRDLEERNKKRAAETGNSEAVQKARDRVVSNGDNPLTSEQNTIDQQNAGFTGAEIARLVSIGADITSMFLDPVTGTAVGLVSSLNNFGADIADDGFQGKDVWNLAKNVGFDLLGAIPVFGDAVGTGAKITKNLIKWAPRAMAGLAAFQGVQNFDGMMTSWGKLTSGDKEQKLTVQDWRNIAQSIGLLTGGVRAGRSKLAQSKMKKQALVDGVLGVNVRTKDGDIQQILVNGDVAKQIREAKGDKAQIETILNGLDDFKGKFGEAGTLEVATKSGGWQNPIGRHEVDGGTGKEWGWNGFRREGLADVRDVYDFSRLSGPYQSVGNRRWQSGQPEVIHDQKGRLTDDLIQKEIDKILTQNNVETKVGNINTAMETRRGYISDLDGNIASTRSSVDELKAANGGVDFARQLSDADLALSGMPNKASIIGAQHAVAHNQAVIDRSRAKQSALAEARTKRVTDMETGSRAKVEQAQTTLKDLQAEKKRIESRLKDGKRHPKLEARLKSVNSQLRSVRRTYNSLNRGLDASIDQRRTTINADYQRANSRLDNDIRRAQGELATAQTVASQRAAYDQAVQQRQDAIKGQELQRRLDSLLGRKRALDPATNHTRAYRELETLLSNLRATHGNIGGRQINWDMDTILSKYDAAGAFQQGGIINKNKLNKFLTYAKG